ncbi:ribonucleoside-triphosphate reductase, adenosylcobalamin-dependent, partial [Streptomyces sp. NPDC001356]
MPETVWKTETARTVYERTYRREKPNGELETWPETVRRVVAGNVALVEPRYIEPGEEARLVELIESWKVMPAGRHLKSSGVNDYALNNCWAAGWEPSKPEEHFTFTLLRLAEGGGVGSNYSNHYLSDFPKVVSPVKVHIVCDPSHPDYQDMKEAGLLSDEYAYTWAGAY